MGGAAPDGRIAAVPSRAYDRRLPGATLCVRRGGRLLVSRGNAAMDLQHQGTCNRSLTVKTNPFLGKVKQGKSVILLFLKISL